MLSGYQDNQQCLFVGKVINKRYNQGIQNGLQTFKQPLFTAQMKISNDEIGASLNSQVKMDTNLRQQYDSTPMQNSLQGNRYQQISTAETSANMQMNSNKQKDTKPINKTQKANFMNEWYFDNISGHRFVAKNNQSNKTQINTAQDMDSLNFQVSGTIGKPVLNNYQDLSFRSQNMGKFSRRSNISMAMPKWFGGNDEVEDRDYASNLQNISDSDRKLINMFMNGKKLEKKKPSYKFNQLEPIISESSVWQFYEQNEDFVNILNRLMKKAKRFNDGDDRQIEALTEIKEQIQKNAEHYSNYELLWESLAPVSQGGGVLPSSDSDLAQAINKSFGSFDDFFKDLQELSQFQMGQTPKFLVYNKETDKIELIDPKEKYFIIDFNHQLVPIMEINSYRLCYDQDKPNYLQIKEVFKIINWKKVEQRFSAAKSANTSVTSPVNSTSRSVSPQIQMMDQEQKT